MNLQEIKEAINNGQKVYWANENYEVILGKSGYYLIECVVNGNCIGLTHIDGVTLNGNENEFYTIKN
jgi:hypothetical protein